MSDEKNTIDDSGRGHGERKTTVTGARRMLGMIGRNYTDDQVQEVLDILYGMAEVAYDAYVDDHFGPPDVVPHGRN